MENEPRYPMARPDICDTAAENTSALALCGARTRQGGECRHVAMRNGRCRFHGGLSTGRKTKAGIERQRAAVTRHGGRSLETIEFRRLVRQLRADARRVCEAV